jgi:hypothetical protein
MNQSMQPAIQHLFQVSSLEAVSREQLEKFVEEYPCFGFGHYLLSRKLRAENPDQFLAATHKTSLYFSNPFWLQWMLEHVPEPEEKYSPLQDHSTEPAPLYTGEPIEDEEPPFVLDETDHTVSDPAGITALQADPDGPATAAELLLESLEKARALRESLQKINEDYQSHNGHPSATEASPRPVEEPIREDEPPVVAEPSTTPLAEATIITETPSPTIIAETTPLFEPLHTIDYFASQGIRLTLDENPTDPLGRQLKSFTEWLRTMRRLPQKDREIVPNRVAEQAVQNFAAHSIEGKEPVTETMAEVLAKQGMPDRARIVYEKLSLLNPEKSAYFATKIEQLNIH